MVPKLKILNVSQSLQGIIEEEITAQKSISKEESLGVPPSTELRKAIITVLKQVSVWEVRGVTISNKDRVLINKVCLLSNKLGIFLKLRASQNSRKIIRKVYEDNVSIITISENVRKVIMYVYNQTKKFEILTHFSPEDKLLITKVKFLFYRYGIKDMSLQPPLRREVLSISVELECVKYTLRNMIVKVYEKDPNITPEDADKILRDGVIGIHEQVRKKKKELPNSIFCKDRLLIVRAEFLYKLFKTERYKIPTNC
jgi:hypothetical protein